MLYMVIVESLEKFKKGIRKKITLIVPLPRESSPHFGVHKNGFLE